jgi:hypothetical protein
MLSTRPWQFGSLCNHTENRLSFRKSLTRRMTLVGGPHVSITWPHLSSVAVLSLDGFILTAPDNNPPPHSITDWMWKSSPWESNSRLASQKFISCCGIRKFINKFVKVRNWTSPSHPDEFNPHPTLNFNIIITFMPRLPSYLYASHIPNDIFVFLPCMEICSTYVMHLTSFHEDYCTSFVASCAFLSLPLRFWEGKPRSLPAHLALHSWPFSDLLELCRW